LSVNKAWQGRRYKSEEYTAYEKELSLKLRGKKFITEEKLELHINVGYSNKLSDIDNFLKPFIDVLQKNLGFNDRQIYKLVINKSIVNKNEEFIRYRLAIKK